MIRNNIFLQKTTHLTLNLKIWCTSTLKYVGITVEFAYFHPSNNVPRGTTSLHYHHHRRKQDVTSKIMNCMTLLRFYSSLAVNINTNLAVNCMNYNVWQCTNVVKLQWQEQYKNAKKISRESERKIV